MVTSNSSLMQLDAMCLILAWNAATRYSDKNMDA